MTLEWAIEEIKALKHKLDTVEHLLRQIDRHSSPTLQYDCTQEALRVIAK